MNTDLTTLCAVFAAKSADPPLDWPAVQAFEAEHGITLPEPYRTFVAEIANGCRCGPPYYGLLPLAELPDDWGDQRPQREPAKPFPLTEAWDWDSDPRPAGEIEALLDPVFDHGSIVLGTDGCGMNWHLVVTGPQRGRLWHITGEGAHPWDAPGFAAWVEHWAADKPWFQLD